MHSDLTNVLLQAVLLKKECDLMAGEYLKNFLQKPPVEDRSVIFRICSLSFNFVQPWRDYCTHLADY